jgi:post-segregation antitoxin (ccd killing protein)
MGNGPEPAPIMIEVAPGELLDKISILEIKLVRLNDPGKLHNVGVELAMLERARDASLTVTPVLEALCKRLKRVNESLWETEDAIREEEHAGRFGSRFIALARSIYRDNDERAAVKRDINLSLGSAIVEEKSYSDYAGGAGDRPPAGALRTPQTP